LMMMSPLAHHGSLAGQVGAKLLRAAFVAGRRRGGQHLPTVGLVVATVDPLYGTGGQAVWPSDHESAPEDLGRLHCHLGHLEHIGGRPAQCHDPVVAEVVSRGALPSSARWASIPLLTARASSRPGSW